MAQLLLFIYSLIIFLSLFFGEAALERTETTMHNVQPSHFIPCFTAADCPMIDEPHYIECVTGFCWALMRNLH
ncbi:putative Late nodulin [Medicago truncatula]|uniref:Nodule Cysteine-Rich (NCR) secreted peptide n=1 Tax=Medicago truncatula TaxID=3880 RepID=A0A072TR88_MEDTR|nr:Nodule Cysteine-Rich (NCR) secreted peptide [Medicago truncatula]RHN51997.1 putative Late nodulin [Medicago truncatula]RHN52000.1 putative Late nodulin [Medicago truncatula]